MGNLANVAHTDGDYPASRALNLESLKIWQNIKDRSGEAVTLNNLAVLYKSEGEYAQAAPLYRQALAIFEAALGPAHPNVVACRENYAQLVREMERV